MIDFWSVLGCACLNSEFRYGIRHHRCSDLELLRHLAGAPFYVRLSRQEACLLRHFYREENDIYERLDRLDHLIEFQIELCGDLADPRIREDIEVCAVVGLALIDGEFRERACDFSEPAWCFQRFLAGELPGNLHRFYIGRERALQLREVIQNEPATDLMEQISQDNWVPPSIDTPFYRALARCPEGVNFTEDTVSAPLICQLDLRNLNCIPPGDLKTALLALYAVLDKDAIEETPWVEVVDRVIGGMNSPIDWRIVLSSLLDGTGGSST